MRILHVAQLYWPFTGGSERHLAAIAERQAAAGHDVTVVTTDAYDLELFWSKWARRVEEPSELHNGVRIVRLPVHHLPVPELTFPAVRHLTWVLSRTAFVPTSILHSLGTATPRVPDLAAWLASDEARSDIVHGMNICFESLLNPARALASRIDVPFVLTPLTHLAEREGDSVSRYYTMRHQIEIAREADAVMAQTAIERDYLVRRGVDPARTYIAGVGVDPEPVTGGDCRRFVEAYGVEPPFVFYVGTAAYDKGTVHLVEAMRALWAEGEVAHLVIAGASLRAFRDYVDQLPSRDRERCHLLGFIPEERKRDLFAAGTVFAMPSRTDSFGIVYLEAWLNGLPVIGARAGGVPEVVDHGTDGLLVRFGDVQELAAAVGQLLADRHLRERMGRAGRAKTLSRYTWDAIYPRIESVYDGLAARRGVDGRKA
jgi:glycosyltransferase involved in cell wall biosynthesis